MEAFVRELKYSFQMEGEKISNKKIDKILSLEDITPEAVHQVFCPKIDFKRSHDIAVIDIWGNVYHKGIKVEFLDEAIERLKDIVENADDSIRQAIFNYLIYERVHPSPDGNGRVGRYLFFENPIVELFPLATYLETSHNGHELMDKIWQLVSDPIGDKPLDWYFDIKDEGELARLVDELIEKVKKII
jgi:hypothetical protein